MKKLLFLLFTAISMIACSSPEDTNVLSPVEQTTIEYTLTINSSSGGTVSSPGGTYEEGATVNITATPNSEYLFENWSNGSTNNPLTLTVSQDITLTANFVKRKYPLTVNIQGEGTVGEEIVTAGKTTTEYTSGSIIRLTANSASEWEFLGWSESVSSTTNPIEVTVDEAKAITASFVKRKYPLTINIQGEGTVSEEIVTTGKTTTEYTSGSIIRLTANSASEWEFLGWSGSISSTTNPIEVTLDEVKTITATFDYEILSYAEQVCGLSLIEWSSHSLGYDTTFYFQVSDQDYVLTQGFQNSFIKSPKLLDKYVVLNGMGDSSGVSINEVESICSDISVNQDLSINVDFSYDYSSVSLDPYLNIHSGIIDPGGSLREFQNLPEGFVGSTFDYFPIQIQDVDDNLVIEFNYEYLMFSDQISSDVFLINMFVFPERDGKWNKQKEIGIMLTRGDYYVNEYEITIDNRVWYDEQIAERYPHPLFSDEPDSYFNNKYYILKDDQTEMLDEKMRIRVKPFLDDLIEKGFMSPNEYLMFIETGIEVRAGRNQGGYLNISNYKILTD